MHGCVHLESRDLWMNTYLLRPQRERIASLAPMSATQHATSRRAHKNTVHPPF